MSHAEPSPFISDQDYREIIAALDRDDGEVIYQEGQQAIVRFQAGQRDLIAKTYHLTSFKQKLAALFRYSRGRRSFRAGLRLVSAGITTPHPFILREGGGTSVLVTEFCDHPSLLQQITNGAPLHPSTPENVLKLLNQLVAIRCSHGDFHARNILIDPQGALHLIDLDGLQYRHRSSEVLRHSLKDRDRLLRSLAPLPEYHSKFVKVLGAPGDPLPVLSS